MKKTSRNPAFLFCILILFIHSCTSTDIGKTVGDAWNNRPLTEAEAGEGIKEALTIGISKGADEVARTDGYFGNPLIRIPFPPQAMKVEKTLRDVGLGAEVDKVILSLNRAAEDAATEAKPIFINAIKQLTIRDALNIVRGANDAATGYLKDKTSDQLTAAFKPKISASLDKVNATRYWTDIMNLYNKVPFVEPVNTDLTSYVTNKAIDGLFIKVAEEELRIRENPIARTTELLKRVFGSKN
ncbi:MAG: DUF4197 domain-containing protein [Bacteroidia bacterium]